MGDKSWGKNYSHLKDSKAIGKYKQQWLDEFLNLEVQSATGHRWVRYRLQAKLKVPRTTNPKPNLYRFKELPKNSVKA